MCTALKRPILTSFMTSSSCHYFFFFLSRHRHYDFMAAWRQCCRPGTLSFSTLLLYLAMRRHCGQTQYELHSAFCILHSAFFIGLAIRFSIDSRCEEAMTTSVESVVQKEISNQRCSKKDEMTDWQWRGGNRVLGKGYNEHSAIWVSGTVQKRERERTFEYGTNGHILLFSSPVTLAGLARQNEQT